MVETLRANLEIENSMCFYPLVCGESNAAFIGIRGDNPAYTVLRSGYCLKEADRDKT